MASPEGFWERVVEPFVWLRPHQSLYVLERSRHFHPSSLGQVQWTVLAMLHRFRRHQTRAAFRDRRPEAANNAVVEEDDTDILAVWEALR